MWIFLYWYFLFSPSKCLSTLLHITHSWKNCFLKYLIFYNLYLSWDVRLQLILWQRSVPCSSLCLNAPWEPHISLACLSLSLTWFFLTFHVCSFQLHGGYWSEGYNYLVPSLEILYKFFLLSYLILHVLTLTFTLTSCLLKQIFISCTYSSEKIPSVSEFLFMLLVMPPF